MHGRPGHRFQDHYHRATQERQSAAAGRRVVNVVLAGFSLVLAFVLVIFPGPAIPFFFLAGVLLASESLAVARLMDWLELKFRAAWRWGKRRWDRLPHAARVTMKLLAPCASLAGVYFTWHLLRE